MLFHCVISLPCCGIKQTFSDSGMTDGLSRLTHYLHMPLCFFLQYQQLDFVFQDLCDYVL